MKPQCKTILTHLMTGEVITRDLAFHRFGIQNLTARLTEVERAGFQLERKKLKTRTDTGRELSVTTWKLRHIFRKGDMVKALADGGSFLTVKGRYGVIDRLYTDEPTAVVSFGSGIFRRMALKDLAPVPHLAPGTRVTVDTSHLVVARYVPEGDTYLLFSPDPDKTIAASASLIREMTSVDAAMQ